MSAPDPLALTEQEQALFEGLNTLFAGTPHHSALSVLGEYLLQLFLQERDPARRELVGEAILSVAEKLIHRIVPLMGDAEWHKVKGVLQ